MMIDSNSGKIMNGAAGHGVLPPEAGAEASLRRQLEEAHQHLRVLERHCDRLELQLRDGLRREQRHKHRAEHDDLTGLLNRAAFRERATQALQNPGGHAVLLLDMDDFKQVNDRLGHAAGDDVLRIVAARLVHVLRAGDLVSRLGGDEFACLLTGIADAQQLSVLDAKLGAVFAAPMQLAAHRITTSASLGFARCPEEGADLDTLLARADAAMYLAKRARLSCGQPAAPSSPVAGGL